jgi:hypothetical protein
VFEGNGSDVVDLAGVYNGPAIVLVEAGGGDDFFSISVLNADLEEEDYVVGEITPFAGRYPLGWRSYLDEPAFLQVEASAAWRIEIQPLTAATPWDGSGHAGAGADVLSYGGERGFASYDFQGDAYTSVDFWGTRDDFPENLVNEVAPVNGRAPMPAGPGLVVVEAGGPWTMSVEPV